MPPLGAAVQGSRHPRRQVMAAPKRGHHGVQNESSQHSMTHEVARSATRHSNSAVRLRADTPAAYPRGHAASTQGKSGRGPLLHAPRCLVRPRPASVRVAPERPPAITCHQDHTPGPLAAPAQATGKTAAGALSAAQRFINILWSRISAMEQASPYPCSGLQITKPRSGDLGSCPFLPPGS